MVLAAVLAAADHRNRNSLPDLLAEKISRGWKFEMCERVRIGMKLESRVVRIAGVGFAFVVLLVVALQVVVAGRLLVEAVAAAVAGMELVEAAFDKREHGLLERKPEFED